jgi:NADH:ubiquinone oxidoreductase subunit F (NADH-binding)
VGLFGKPSNINNVKTLAYVPQIILKGGDWFASIGQDKSKGTAILCLSGDLKYTGLMEVPLGVTMRHVIENMAGGSRSGKRIKALQTGGPLGGVLSGDGMDIALDFEVMAKAGAILGSGGIIAADENTCVVDLTRNLVAFCQYESCGKCFPCRTGMSHLLEVLERICRFEGTAQDLELMQTVGQSMQAGSLCGHGQLGFNPVSSALKFFGPEFDKHLRDKVCPTGRCNEPWHPPVQTRRY